MQLPLYYLKNYGKRAGGLEPDNSTILKKKYESKDLFRKGTNMPDVTAIQTVIEFMLRLTCYNALHMSEWAEKIQTFGVT